MSSSARPTPLERDCPPQHRIASSGSPRQRDALNGDREQEQHHSKRYENGSHAFPLPTSYMSLTVQLRYSIG